MRRETIETAVNEAKRFIERAEEFMWVDTGNGWEHPRESGALRRASMDLTRALADMRRVGR